MNEPAEGGAVGATETLGPTDARGAIEAAEVDGNAAFADADGAGGVVVATQASSATPERTSSSQERDGREITRLGRPSRRTL